MSFRVLTGLFGHETNSFSRLPTDLGNFRDYLLAFGEEVPGAVGEGRIEPAGVAMAERDFGWSLHHSVAAWATPSGPVTREAWSACCGAILEAANSAGPFDGVLLNLHGAMATEDHDDGEGELLAQLRERIGPEVPVAITLDLHANVTDRMAAHADIVVAYRTYPHIDQVETARRAAGLLDRAMRGEVRPVTHLARRDLLTALDDGRTTTDNPMTELLSRGAALERDEPGILAVSVQAGFSPADLAEAGPSVCVTGDGRNPRFQQIAESFMDFAWETRHVDSNTYLSVSDTLAAIRSLLPPRMDKGAAGRASGGPIVVADFADNPGAGAYGDSTFLLEGLIEAGLERAALGPLADPEAAAHLTQAGEGAVVRLSLGGKVDPRYGPPLEVSGEVRRVTDGTYVASGPRWKGVTHRLGPTAVLRVGGVDIVVASNRLQCTELEVFSHAGIDPCDLDIVVVKSMHHFRAAYGPIAREILICDSGALATRDLTRMPYRRLRRPIFPLDMD